MPSAFLSLRRALAAAAAAALLAGVPGGGAAQTKSAQVSIEVPKGTAKSVRLRRLPRGTAVAIVVVSSAKLALALVSESELRSTQPRALFSGAFERTLSFSVVIPSTSDYFLVLDNRKGSEDVSATAAIRARRQPPAKPPAPAPKGGSEERAGLQVLTT